MEIPDRLNQAGGGRHYRLVLLAGGDTAPFRVETALPGFNEISGCEEGWHHAGL
jgi:hypothetical protein